MMKISCLILAAGKSTRMGTMNKLMLEVDGTSLIRRTLNEIQKLSFEEVLVVTGHECEKVTKAIQDLRPEFSFNRDFEKGMHSSIKHGLKAFRKTCDGFFICLADQPYLDHQVLKTLMENFEEGKIIVPVYEGKRGNPVLISSKFGSEILEEPDGDYGCAYLLKRHPEAVVMVPVDSQGILIDIDGPLDYRRVLENSYDSKDPVEEFYLKTLELRRTQEAFVIATVIEVMGSASARTGSKAIFNSKGENLLGWVGGGCAERFIGEESVSALNEGKTRVVLADLDDEIFGLGVACGGKMKVFLDPVLPSETILLPHTEKFQNEIRSLSGFYGLNVKKDFKEKGPETLPELLTLLSKGIAKKRGRSHESLRIIKNVPATFTSCELESNEVTIIGRTRITEALARHFTLLNYDIRIIGPDIKQEDYPSSIKCHCLTEGYGDISFREGELVVIASHTSQDPVIVEKALKSGCSYVGMVGSYKRSVEVLSHLGLMGKEVTEPLFVPAGLDMDARNPDEIALSITAEILMMRKKR